MAPSHSEAALGRILNQTRLDQIKAFGFWNASAEQGVWRVVACHRHGPNPGAESETACALYWTNQQGQQLAAKMLGDTSGKLHRTLDSAACFRALALAAASQAALAADVSWTEAGMSGPTREASDSATARMLCFDEEEILGMAAGFALLAQSGFGIARFSSPGFARKAARCAGKLPATAFNPALGAQTREAVSPKADLFSLDGALYDARAAARALGLPFSTSLMAPAMEHIGASFVSISKLQSEMAQLPCQGRGLNVHLEPLADAQGRSAFPDSRSPSAVFQSRQDAQALGLHLPSSAASEREKRSPSL
jgi:hypothetical protein